MKDVLKAVVCSTVLATVAAPAMAETPFETEIEARQAHFQVVKFNMGILGAMAKGKREYNAELAEASAKNILKAATMDNGAMWPKGSDNGVDALADVTKAKPGIWSNFPDVQDKHKAWASASEKLASTAGQGLDSLRQNIGPVGKSCKGCHKEYKAK